MPKRKPILSKPLSGAPARRGWTLIIIDQEPIRRAATEAYCQARARLTELRGTLERFATEDRAAFGSWVAERFGPVLTELRETEEKIDERGRMLDRIDMLTFLNGVSSAEAYAHVVSGAPLPPPPGGGKMKGKMPAGIFGPGSPLEAFFAAVQGNFGSPPPPEFASEPPEPEPEPEPAPRRAGRARRPAGATPSQRAASQALKGAYRAVVRRLHPDLRADLTEYDRQLWHDAQDAYARGDLERLETILALGEMGAGGEWPASSGIGGLLEMIRQTGASIRQLERQMRTASKDIAWGFTSLASTGPLARKVGARLRGDVTAARRELALIEDELAFYRNAPPPRGSARGKTGKKKPRQPRR